MMNRLEPPSAEPNRQHRPIWGQVKHCFAFTIVVLILLVSCIGLDTSDKSSDKSIVLARDLDASVLAFSPDGQNLAVASVAGTAGTIGFWDLANLNAKPTFLTVFTDYEDRIAAFSPDLRILASYWVDGTIHLWDLTNPGSDPVVLTGHGHSIMCVRFSPDGQLLAVASEDNRIRLWDLSNLGSAPVTLIVWGGSTTGGTGAREIAFSPDGRILAASVGFTHTVFWDLADPGSNPTLLPKPEGGLRQTMTVAISPDGETIAGGCGNDICLWNVRARSGFAVKLSGHSNLVYQVTFSPDGKTLVSTSSDRTMRLWDMSNRSASPVVFKYNASHIVFSPDGRKLAFTNWAENETIRLLYLSD
jgi:WD40 repeat protein